MIKELHKKLVAGEITSVFLTEQYFERIEQNDREIGAYLTLLKESALTQARLVDAKLAKGESIGIIEGIPCAIKDNICIKDVRTTAGSKILDNYIAPYDATVITKLKTAGAVMVGKTNMDEFAMGSSTENSAYKTTKNPLDTERVPGGSSGGSAAAVASDEAVFALGTDTGGSIRQPASFCGLVGLKPTYGRVSRYGALAMGSSLDQIGPLGKTAEDVAIVLSIIAGEDSMDATTAEVVVPSYESTLTGDISGLKIGIPAEYFSDALDREIKKVADDAIATFQKMGATIVPVGLPNSQFALPAYYIVMPAEVSSNLARFDGVKYGLRVNDKEDSIASSNTLLETYLDTRRFGFGEEVKRRIMLGTYILSAGYYDAYYVKAQKVRALLRADFKKVFEQVDVIFSPTSPEVAFKLGSKTEDPLTMYLSDIYTVTANLVGVPALSFPIGTVINESTALPVGGHLMAKWFDEATLLRTADAFEKSQK
jgi:aspartyl-tRNA(Asn)/glutamyl-tRNA(Gln) amidotransferase subunit A